MVISKYSSKAREDDPENLFCATYTIVKPPLDLEYYFKNPNVKLRIYCRLRSKNYDQNCEI